MTRRRQSPRDELAEGSAVGDVYLRRLVRAQLTLSLTALATFGGVVGALPLLLLLLPELVDVRPLGVPLPIVLVGAPAFAGLLAIGIVYQRRADALDVAFGELVDPDDPPR